MILVKTKKRLIQIGKKKVKNSQSYHEIFFKYVIKVLHSVGQEILKSPGQKKNNREIKY